MPENESHETPRSSWVELPPVASEITVPLSPVVDEPGGVERPEFSPALPADMQLSLEAAEALADEAGDWRVRAANVQATALYASSVFLVIWMTINVYGFLESHEPDTSGSHISQGFYTTTSLGMILCGALMACTSAAAATYRSRAWGIEQGLEDKNMPS